MGPGYYIHVSLSQLVLQLHRRTHSESEMIFFFLTLGILYISGILIFQRLERNTFPSDKKLFLPRAFIVFRVAESETLCMQWADSAE